MSSDDNPKAHVPHVYTHPHAGQPCRCIKLCTVCKMPESNLIHHIVAAYGTTVPTPQMRNDAQLREDLRVAINRNSRESRSNTPDHILADYLMQCLQAYEAAHNNTQVWMDSNPTYGRYVTRADPVQEPDWSEMFRGSKNIVPVEDSVNRVDLMTFGSNEPVATHHQIDDGVVLTKLKEFYESRVDTLDEYVIMASKLREFIQQFDPDYEAGTNADT